MSNKKSNERAKTLGKFRASTLSAQDLSKVAGGILDDYPLECTCSTYSKCHLDGTDDLD